MFVFGILFMVVGALGFFLLNQSEAVVALPGVSMAIANLIFFVLVRKKNV